jgi:hypothetical protein
MRCELLVSGKGIGVIHKTLDIRHKTLDNVLVGASTNQQPGSSFQTHSATGTFGP